ncbi:hypothetical protein LIER_17310 [Lithospermum erythrorhizon]|uniref:DUF4283 domain-containing protein n=1 Tax=Lithospermum erythrorhizon TaxID=34254 RepID=A0AAV3QB97_LITER
MADNPIDSSGIQPNTKPSFAQLLRSTIEVPQDMVGKDTSSYASQPPMPELKPTSMKDGNPSVVFKVSDKHKYINKMKHVLIGKFSHGRPAIGLIKEFFVGLKLKGEYNVSLYDTKHLFIECSLMEDFTRLWMRITWYVKGFAMRMFKWTPEFNPHKESPLSPVWAHFDGLPLYLFDHEALLSIANSIGSPLRIDHNNINRVKLGQASVCVALDMSRPIKDKVWIAFEDEDLEEIVEGFWQPVTYDSYPAYCSGCCHLGHAMEACKRKVEDPLGNDSNTNLVGDVDKKTQPENTGNKVQNKHQFRRVPRKQVYRKVVKPQQGTGSEAENQVETTKAWAARVFLNEKDESITKVQNSFAALEWEEESPLQYNSNPVSYGAPLQAKSALPSPTKINKEPHLQGPLEDNIEGEVVIEKEGDLPIYE